MSDDLVKQAVAELQDVVRCCDHPKLQELANSAAPKEENDD